RPGADPRLQWVREDDGSGVRRRRPAEDQPGCCSVAGDGVLLLSPALRRAGRPYVPVPAPSMAGRGDAGRRFAGLSGFSPELLRWLTYGRVIDTTALEKELGWRPKYSSEAAFADFLGAQGLGRNPLASLLGRL